MVCLCLFVADDSSFGVDGGIIRRGGHDIKRFPFHCLFLVGKAVQVEAQDTADCSRDVRHAYGAYSAPDDSLSCLEISCW